MSPGCPSAKLHNFGMTVDYRLSTVDFAFPAWECLNPPGELRQQIAVNRDRQRGRRQPPGARDCRHQTEYEVDDDRENDPLKRRAKLSAQRIEQIAELEEHADVVLFRIACQS